MTTSTTRPASASRAQHAHHLPVQRRIQPGGRFIEDQQRGPGEQFHGHRGAFALAAGEFVDPGAGVAGQLQFLEHPATAASRSSAVACGSRSSAANRSACFDGQLVVHHVVLGDQPDAVAQRRVLGVQVTARRNSPRRRSG